MASARSAFSSSFTNVSTGDSIRSSDSSSIVSGSNWPPLLPPPDEDFDDDELVEGSETSVIASSVELETLLAEVFFSGGVVVVVVVVLAPVGGLVEIVDVDGRVGGELLGELAMPATAEVKAAAGPTRAEVAEAIAAAVGVPELLLPGPPPPADIPREPELCLPLYDRPELSRASGTSPTV